MRYKAAAAILYAVFCIAIVAFALFTECVQRAIAEQAVEILRLISFVAWEEFALLMLKKRVFALLRLLIKRFFILAHFIPPYILAAADSISHNTRSFPQGKETGSPPSLYAA